MHFHIFIKILVVPPPGPGMPLIQKIKGTATHAQRGGGYLFLPGFSSMNDAIHGWMTGRMDGWVS